MDKIIKKSFVIAKETIKLATSTVVGTCCAKSILNAVKRPNREDKCVAGIVGCTVGATSYCALDMVDCIITESVERVKRA